MKKAKHAVLALVVFGFSACQKSNETSQISLTPSTTQTTIGQTVSVTLSANANVSNWTVTPSSTATKTYGLTTSKVNYFTFSQTGVYSIAVSARNIVYDSTLHISLDSCWNHSGGSRGGCTKGVDSTSVTITVTK